MPTLYRATVQLFPERRIGHCNLIKSVQQRRRRSSTERRRYAYSLASTLCKRGHRGHVTASNVCLQSTTAFEGISTLAGGGHPTLHADFRPVYPKSVTNMIATYMRSNGCSGYRYAVDVGCGSGQSTLLLCEHFTHVSGYDISREKIRLAESKRKSTNSKNTHFRVGDAHDLPLKTSSVDLLTCAMSWQWLDAEKLYNEAKRVLKPQGCIAVYGYNAKVSDHEQIGVAIDTFIAYLTHSGCYNKQSMHSLNNYEAVELPFSQTQRLTFTLPQRASMDQVIGFMSSIRLYRTYCERFPRNNLLEDIRKVYEKETGKSAAEKVEFSYPGFIIIGMN